MTPPNDHDWIQDDSGLGTCDYPGCVLVYDPELRRYRHAIPEEMRP